MFRFNAFSHGQRPTYSSIAVSVLAETASPQEELVRSPAARRSLHASFGSAADAELRTHAARRHTFEGEQQRRRQIPGEPGQSSAGEAQRLGQTGAASQAVRRRGEVQPRRSHQERSSMSSTSWTRNPRTRWSVGHGSTRRSTATAGPATRCGTKATRTGSRRLCICVVCVSSWSEFVPGGFRGRYLRVSRGSLSPAPVAGLLRGSLCCMGLIRAALPRPSGSLQCRLLARSHPWRCQGAAALCTMV